MANIQIPNLPAVASLSGAELFEGVQAGTSVKISLDQVIAASRIGTPIALPFGVSVGGTGADNPADARTNLGLGTISTQNSNSVTITGGSITGITDLAVTDGGTGVSTLTGYVKGNGTSPFTASATVPSTDITGLGTMSVQDANNVTITGGSITGITDLAVADGGTGLSTYTVGDILYASATSTLAKLPDVATGNALISGGVGVAPQYGKIGLTTHVSGVLPVANGGTGVTTAPAEAARILGFTSTTTTAGTTILTADSTQYQLFTGTLAQTITLPVTSTIAAGWSFHIVNNSTGSLTVNSSGGNLVCTIIPQLSAMVTCIGTTLTTAADWEFGFTDFGSVTGTGSVVLGTGPTITNGALNGTVGATTPSTGSFTTLAASSTVSGTGFTNYFASPPAIGGTAAASVTGAPIVSTTVTTDGFTTLANGTLALALASRGVVQVTPTATGTFTTTVPPAGTRSTLIVLTTGVTSFTMTFGTGFKTTGTLATGTVAARYFIFQFISDGTSVIEASRTVAIA